MELRRAESVGFVSSGNGSVNDSHFLSAVNAAAYATHRGFKCSVLFAFSDSGLNISLHNYGYLPLFVDHVRREGRLSLRRLPPRSGRFSFC